MKYGKMLLVLGILLLSGVFVVNGIVYAVKDTAVEETTDVNKVEEEMKKPEGPPKPTEGMASLDMVVTDLIAIAQGTATGVQTDRTRLLFITLAYEEEISNYIAALTETTDKLGSVNDVMTNVKKLIGGEIVTLSEIVAKENTATEGASFFVGTRSRLEVHSLGVANTKNVARNMLNLGLALPGAIEVYDNYDFAFADPSERQYEAILFTEKFAMQNNSGDFVEVVNGLKENQIAVVIAEETTWENVWKQLQDIVDPNIQARIAKGDLKVMSVADGSTAYVAFEKLFAGQNYFNLSERIQTLDDLMKKEVLDALEGAV